jgi:hypothetical protein
MLPVLSGWSGSGEVLCGVGAMKILLGVACFPQPSGSGGNAGGLLSSYLKSQFLIKFLLRFPQWLFFGPL